MIDNFKLSFQNLKNQLRANLVDLVDYFTTQTESTGLVLLMMSLSAFLVCVGLNFNHSLIIYAGLLISPFIFHIIQFTLGLYLFNFDLVKSSIIKIFFSSILAIFIGFIYFKISPFAFDLGAVKSFSTIEISTFIAVFILGLSLDVFNRHRIQLFIWILKLLIKWLTLLVVAGFAASIGDWDWLWTINLHHKLVFLFFFIGMTLLLYSFQIDRNSDTSNSRWRILCIVITVLFFIFGIYFGLNELMRQTTEFNVDKYLTKGIEAKNFQLHNFTIEKKSKTIHVFYSGLKPAIAQDESIKKKYNLSGYHVEYIDIKK